MSLFRQEVIDCQQTRLHGEVVLTQPLSTRLLVAALVVILVMAGLWLIEGTYARTEMVRGILVTSPPSAKVMASTPGVVTLLNVREGTTVSKGDLLGVIDVGRRDRNGALLAKTSVATLDERLSLTKDQLNLTRKHERDERSRLHNVIRSANEKLAGLDSQIALQRDIVASDKALFDKLEPVMSHGFVSKVEYEQRRQTWLNSRQQLGSLNQQRVSVEGDRAAAQAQLAELSDDTVSAMNDIRSSAQSLAQQRAEIRGEGAYSLVAPISGRVTALQISLGRAVRADVPLLIIVPEHAKLKAQIYAPSRAIGFVRPGQEVRLLYDAFPYQRFGSFPGKVRSVSRTVLDPQDLHAPFKIEEPVYKVAVTIDRQFVDAYAERVPLQAGMTLTANMVLERQSFMSWLLSPLRAVMKRTR